MPKLVKSSSGPLVLSIDDPLAPAGTDNPLTITSRGTITTTASGGAAISGPAGTTWMIDNSGLISSATGWAVWLAGDGILHNAGIISGNLGGISIGGGGTITNSASGQIEAAGSSDGTAVSIAGGFGTVTNHGSIVASTDESWAPSVAISMAAGGTVTNSAGGWIGTNGPYSNGTAVSIAGGFGTVTNRGSIVGGNTGVRISDSGAVTNTGSITGGTTGVWVNDGTVTNRGLISAQGQSVQIDNGGTFTNRADGVVQGGPGSKSTGVVINGFGGTVINQGLVLMDIGPNIGHGIGIRLPYGGSIVTNEGSIVGGSIGIMSKDGAVINDGLISVQNCGVSFFGASGTVINQGTITGRFGIDIEGVTSTEAIGTVTNRGLISGVDAGVWIGPGSGTVINSGTISGTKSVVFAPGATNNLLVINPEAVFNGLVDARDTTNSTIELARHGGTLSGVGDEQYLGFDRLAVDSGADWMLKGPNTIGTVLDNGILRVFGSLTVSTAIDPASSGIFKLDGAATLEVAAILGANSTMSFQAGSELVVDDFELFGQNVGTSNYAGPLLEHFGGSTIDLKDFGIAGIRASFSDKSGGLLQLTNAAAQATLDFRSSGLGCGPFHFDSDGTGGVLITHS